MPQRVADTDELFPGSVDVTEQVLGVDPEQVSLRNAVQPTASPVPTQEDGSFLDQIVASARAGLAEVELPLQRLQKLSTVEVFGTPVSLLPGGFPVTSEQFKKRREEINRTIAEAPRTTAEEALKKGEFSKFAVNTIARGAPNLAAMVAGGAPAVLALNILNTGEIFTQLKEEGVDDLKAAKFALASGATEAALDLVVIDKVLGNLAATPMREALKKGLLNSAKQSTIRKAASEVAANSATTTALLGGESVTQEAANVALRSIILNEEVPEDVVSQLVNSGIEGSILGFATGASTSSVGAGRAIREARRKVPLATEKDFEKLTPEQQQLMDKLGDSEASDPILPGDKFRREDGREIEVVEVEPNSIGGEDKLLVEFRSQDQVDTKTRAFTGNAFRKQIEKENFRKVVVEPIAIEEGRELTLSQAAEILGEERFGEVRQLLENGIDPEDIATSLAQRGVEPKDAREAVVKVADSIRPLDIVEGRRERVTSDETVFDPEPPEPILRIKTNARPPKAPEDLDASLGAIGDRLDDVTRGLVGGRTPEQIADSLGEIGVSKSAIVRAVSFIGDRIRSFARIPRNFNVEGIGVESNPDTEFFNRMGLLTDTVNGLINGRSPEEIARVFDSTYEIDTTADDMARKIARIRNDIGEQIETVFGAMESTSPEAIRAIERNTTSQAVSPPTGKVFDVQDVSPIARGKDFEIFASPSGDFKFGNKVSVFFKDKDKFGKRDIFLDQQSLIPNVIFVDSDKIPGNDIDKTVKDYFSDFKADSVELIRPGPPLELEGQTRINNFSAFGRRVETFISDSRSKDTTNFRLIQPNRGDLAGTLKKQNPNQPDFVNVFVEGKPLKKQQAFIIGRLALNEASLPNIREFNVYNNPRTSGGVDVATFDREARSIYNRFARGIPEVESVFNRTAEVIRDVRTKIALTKGLDKDTVRQLTDNVLTEGGLIDSTSLGLTITPGGNIAGLSFGEGKGIQRAIYVDPFTMNAGIDPEVFRGRPLNVSKGLDLSEPLGLALRTVQTAIHEVAHLPKAEEGHNTEFYDRMVDYMGRYGPDNMKTAVEKIQQELDDGTGKLKPRIAEIVQETTALVRRRFNQRNAQARTKTFAIRRASSRSVPQERAEGVSASGEKTFWGRTTGLRGVDLDRFLEARKAYENHILDTYRGQPPGFVSVDFKDFIKARGFDPDLFDGGSPVYDLAGAVTKKVMRQGLTGEPMDRVAADVEKLNFLEKHVLGIRETFDPNAPGNTNPDPRGREYLRLRQEEKEFRNRFAVQVNDIIGKLHNLGRKQSEATVNFLAERTINSTKLRRKQTIKENAALARKHGVNVLGAEVIRDVEGLNERMMNELRSEMENRAKRIMVNDPDGLKSYLDDLGKQFERMVDKLDYFPLMRFGNHFVKVVAPLKKGRKRRDTVTAEAYETRREQQERLEELRKQFPKDKGFDVLAEDIDDTQAQMQGFPPILLDTIKNTLNLSKDAEDKLRALMVSINPGNKFLKGFRRRFGIQGYSREGGRVLADHYNALSGHLAKLKWQDRFDELVNEVKQDMDSATREGNFERADALRSIFQKLDNHNDYTRNPGNELAAIRGGIYKYFMAYNPKSVAVDLMQTPLFTYPELLATESQFNVGTVTAELFKAGRDVASTFDGGNRNHFDNLSKRLTVDESNMLTDLTDNGVLTDSLAKLVAGRHISRFRLLSRLPLLPTGALKGTRAVDRIIDLVGEVGLEGKQGSEEFNRRVAAISKFRLAKKRGASYQQALEEAKQFTLNTQGEFNPFNKIPIARGKKGIAFVLRSFNVFATNFWLRARGRWPHRALMLATAGAAGIPASKLAFSIFDAAANQADETEEGRKILEAAGIDRPGVQIENDLRQLSQEIGLSPSTLANGLSHSSFGMPALTQLFGGNFPEFDLSASLGIGDIVPGASSVVDFATGQRGPEALVQAGLEVGGAGVSVARSMAYAFSDDTPRAMFLRSLAPVALQNLLESREILRRGAVLDRRGNPVLKFDPHNPMDMATVVGNAVGFRPTQIAERQELNFLQREWMQYIIAYKEGLLTHRGFAVANQDEEARKKVDKEIAVFNDSVPPELRITPKILKMSMQNRMNNNVLRNKGLPLTRRFREASKERFGEAREEVFEEE